MIFFEEKTRVISNQIQEISEHINIGTSKNQKNEIKSFFIEPTKNYKMLLIIQFVLLAFLVRDYYQENSIFQKWRFNFLMFFSHFPIFLMPNQRLYDYKYVFLLNFAIFFIDIRNFHQSLIVFIINFSVIYNFRKKILCFFWGYLLLNIDMLISYYIEKELPNDLRANIFLWKLFIFIQIFLFFFLIIRPKKALQKYASFITEM